MTQVTKLQDGREVIFKPSTAPPEPSEIYAKNFVMALYGKTLKEVYADIALSNKEK